MAYNNSTNYQQVINDSVAKGDYAAAAAAERDRNEKIASQGLNYQPTYNYQYTNNSGSSAAFDQYKQSMQASINAYNQSVDSGLQAQQLAKQDAIGTAQRNLETANRAADTAYQRAINPYGYQAQVQASRGNASSGLSESSRIAAANAFQNALAANNTGFSDSVRAADLAYNQAVAQAQSDKSTYLAQNLQTQAATGIQQSQFDAQQSLANKQFDQSVFESNRTYVQNAAEAERNYQLKLTELNDQLATNKLTRAQYEQEIEKAKAELALYKAFAEKQAEADYQQSLADIENTKANTAKLNRS